MQKKNLKLDFKSCMFIVPIEFYYVMVKKIFEPKFKSRSYFENEIYSTKIKS